MIHLMSNSSGLAWSAAKRIIAALRLAEDLPGAGQGFRLLRFTPPVSSGARGGPPVGSQGVHLGITTKGIAREPGGASTEAGFAFPIETVIGLADGSGSQALGSGAALQMGAIRLDRQPSLCPRRVFSCHKY
jgi:S1-C subfamily serine protease